MKTLTTTTKIVNTVDVIKNGLALTFVRSWLIYLS